MGPMLFWLAGVVVLSGVCLVTAFALRATRVAHAKLDAAQRELQQLGLRATQAEAEVDAAIGRLDQLQQLRVDDVQRMRDDVRELRENYERILQRYQTTHAIDGPLGSRRVQ
jgi:putative component of toxin-antitoxin plasmid stabilization module